MSNPLTPKCVQALEAISRNQPNPHPEVMSGLRKSKYVLGHETSSCHSITVRGIQALEKAHRKANQLKEI